MGVRVSEMNESVWVQLSEVSEVRVDEWVSEWITAFQSECEWTMNMNERVSEERVR